jgi:hypothetical protein
LGRAVFDESSAGFGNRPLRKRAVSFIQSYGVRESTTQDTMKESLKTKSERIIKNVQAKEIYMKMN